jgi:hypothetical protein
MAGSAAGARPGARTGALYWKGCRVDDAQVCARMGQGEAAPGGHVSVSLAMYRCPWPYGVDGLLGYLEQRAEAPCGPTIPEAVMSTLAFHEKAGGVARDERLSANSFLRRAVEQMTMQLQQGRPPAEDGGMLFAMMVMSLELHMAGMSASSGVGWSIWLLYLWGTLRGSDLPGALPATARYTRRCPALAAVTGG